jgi:hypothetical protein
MESRGFEENNFVRLHQKSRKAFNVGDKLALGSKGKRIVLHVKQALKDDVKTEKAKLTCKEISPEQYDITAFVTNKVLSYLVGKRRRNLEKYCYITEGVEDLMLGADPEFALVRTDSLSFVPADSYLEHDDAFGSDGPCAELRPHPSTSVEDLVKTMSELFKEGAANKDVECCHFFGGAGYKSPNHPNARIPQIGGHIHIGNSDLLPQDQLNMIYERTVQVLDERIALPLVRVDSPMPEHRRNESYYGQGGYGRYGNYKPQHGRFEWRVPSGFWLIHPTISRAVLGTTKAVTEECYQIMLGKKFSSKWISSTRGGSGFIDTMQLSDPTLVSKLVNNADPNSISLDAARKSLSKLKEMGTYEKYRSEIDDFSGIITLSNSDRKRFNYNLRQTWLDKKGFLL